ncbi:MAG: hypothetical protein OXB95_01295 [Rhodobacteraceae bacterium]|nr:hypothetical protein [Paracoccaceae bacterium]
MPTIFDRSSFPENCLTHHGTAEFWEELGRTIASFSFLEYSVANADFALSSTHQFKTKEEFEAAYKSWEKILQASLTGGLKQRIALLKAHFNGDDRIPKSVAKGIVCRLKEIVDWRNVLCHGAWLQFNEDGSISRRFFKRDSKGF